MKHLLLIFALALTACSTKHDVVMNYDYQLAVAETEKARMEAIQEIARQGDTGAVAAAMMMQNQGKTNHTAPRSGGDTALAWASVIVPSTVQAAGIAVSGLVTRTQSYNNKDVAIVNSNNNTAVAVDTNATMEAIAGVTIVKPEVVTSTTTNTTTNNTTTGK
jgi:uncharacterized protein YcfL